MGFSIAQQKFNSAFIFRANSLIDDLFAKISSEPNWQDALEDKLDQSSLLVGGAIATVGIAAIAAPVTGGMSLAAAGVVLGSIKAGIVITQLASGGYRFMTKTMQSDESESTALEITIDEHKLSFKIAVAEVADILTVSYKNFIDDIVETDSIAAFAYFGAEQINKALQKSILEQLKSHKLIRPSSQALSFYFNPDDLINSLHKTKYIFKLHPTAKVKIQAKHIPRSFMASQYVSIKWAYIRPRIALFTNILGNSTLDFLKSKNESTHFGSKVTLPQYGYVSVGAQYIANQRDLVKCDLEPDKIHDLQNLLCFYYQVSADEVNSYLNFVQDLDPSNRLSLNDYLSKIFKVNLIAECHDDKLKDLDLSGGVFSDVNFRGATLSGNLDNTVWNNARLQNCQFIGTKLTSHTNFNYAQLQKSVWRDLNLMASFVHAKMNSAQIINCLIEDFNHIGCDWELAYIDASCRHPLSNSEWRKATEERLNTELKSRKQEVESQYEEFLDWQSLQQERWESQEKINVSNISRLQFIEDLLSESQRQPILDILKIIYQQGARYSDVMLSEPYIDLNLLPAGVGNIKESISLTERLLSFRDDPLELFFLLHGGIGSGKSVAITRLHQELLISCHDQTDIYPIFIKLKHVQQNTSANFFEQCLLSQFDHAQIAVLKENFSCLVILDGLEDCGIHINDRYIIEECLQFNQDCNQGSWKVILTASTQYLLESQDYRERLRLSSNVPFPCESEYSILPLNPMQINAYIENYYSDKIMQSGINQHDFYKMAQTPIMLHLMCEVLSSLSFIDSAPHSKIEFYQAFLDNWSQYVLQKSGAQRLTSRSILVYLQDFAYQMFTEDKHHIECPIYDERDVLEIERDAQPSSRIDFSYLFDKPLWKKAGTLAPLKVKRDDDRGIMIYQIRPPFRMYALANKLLFLLRQSSIQDVIQSWNYAYLSDSTTFSVFDSLSSLILNHKSKDFLIDILCQIVDASCTNQGHLYSKAASNAITLLNYMGYDFAANVEHHRWRGAHIDKANLRFGKFVGFDFRDAYLRETKWQYAELIGVNMQGADIEGAVFFDGTSSIYTKKHPEAFAVYPSDDPIIAYSVIKRVGSDEREIFLVDTNGNKYPSIYGHRTEIKAMAWGVSNTEPPVAYLASASVHGTLRIWQVHEQKSKEIAKFKVKSEHAINSIRWYKDGDLIATGGDDNCVRIWSMFTRKLVFVYDLQTRVNSVIFGRDEKIMLSVDDDGRLSVWDLNYLHRSSRHNQMPQFQTTAERVRGRALSTALSVPERYIAVGYENGDIVTFALGISRDSPKNAANIDLSVRQVLRQHTRSVDSIVWNAHCLVSGGEDGLVIVWNPNLGVSLAIYRGDGAPVNQVAWLMGGRQVVTSQDRKLAIYDPDYLLDDVSFNNKLNSTLTKVAPTDKHVAMGDVDGKVWLWNIEFLYDKSVKNIFSHSAPIIELLWSIDQRYLAALSSDNILKIFDVLETAKEECQIFLQSSILSIKWVLDKDNSSQQLALCTADSHILIIKQALTKGLEWQIANSQPELILGSPSTLFSSLDIALTSSANLSHFAAFANHQVRIYDKPSLSMFNVILELDAAKEVNQLSFSRNYKYLLAKFADETLVVWNTDTWSEVWRDNFTSHEKNILWCVDKNNNQWLLIATKDDLHIYSAQKDIRSVKRILKCVDNMAYYSGYLYLVERKSVDMLDFSKLVNRDEYKNAFITRFGYGSGLLDLNLTNVKNMDIKTQKHALYYGARITADEVKPSFKSQVLSALGFYNGDFSTLPIPTRQTSTSQRVMHSFYRSNSSLNEAESNSSAGTPVKLVRDTSDGNSSGTSPSSESGIV